MKTSIGSWAYTIGPYETKAVDFTTVIDKLSALNFDGVELGGFPPHPNPDDNPTKESREEVVELVRSRNLTFSGLAANLWNEKLINTDDNSKYISEFKKNCEFCVDLGIKTIRVDTVQSPTIFSEIDQATAKKRVIDTWQVCADIAKDHGLLMTWECEPGFAFNKPSEVIEILEAMDNKDNFGLLYDTCHAQMISVVGARQNGEKEVYDNQIEFLKQVRDKVNHVHLIDSDNTCHKDTNGEDETSAHPPFGLGLLNFDELIPEIQKIDLKTGWWTIDLCFWDNAWEATETCKTELDKIIAKHCSSSAN